MPLEIGIIGAAAVIATYTDIKTREVQDWLTYSVFFLGFAYTFYLCLPGFKHVTLSFPGLLLFLKVLWLWLGTIIKATIFSLIMFMLGLFAGGDGKFFIAISPWAGMLMAKIIYYFFPAAIVLVAVYLLYYYEFNFTRLVKDQAQDALIFFRYLPTIIKNISKMEQEALLQNIPFTTKSFPKPPGMVAISAAILLSLFC